MEKNSKKHEKYYEPTLEKFIKKKVTDKDKALRIYKDIPYNGKEELKMAKRLKQIRHQYNPSRSPCPDRRLGL